MTAKAKTLIRYIHRLASQPEQDDDSDAALLRRHVADHVTGGQVNINFATLQFTSSSSDRVTRSFHDRAIATPPGVFYRGWVGLSTRSMGSS
jgi:hypothetical protein